MILGIDIGGSKILFGLIDDNDSLLNSFSIPLKKDINKEEIISIIKENTTKFKDIKLDGVGITIPGLADPINGIWVLSPFNGIDNFHIVDELKEYFNVPIRIENDVNACAIAEKTYGKTNKNNYIWITISNGIGGAIVINNKLFSGDYGNAGEIGHIIVEEEDGFLCGCGRRGCLEAMASGNGISTIYHRLTGNTLSAKEIGELAKENNESSIKAFNIAGHYIGKALASTINALNITTIYLGGGVMENFDFLKDAIIESINERVFKKANPKIEIYKTSLGYNAALYGAFSLIKR